MSRPFRVERPDGRVWRSFATDDRARERADERELQERQVVGLYFRIVDNRNGCAISRQCASSEERP